MQNHDEIIRNLKKGLSNLKNTGGAAFMVTGESGIGKTNLADSFIENIKQNVCIVSMNGKLTPGGGAFTCFYDGAYKALQNSNLKYEYWFELIKQFSIKLPGFGKYAAAFIKAKEYNAIARIMRLSGFKYDGKSAPHACAFLEKIAHGRDVVLVIDDTQWLDIGSFELLVFALEHLTTLNWVILILVNDSAEPHPEIEKFQEILNGIFKKNKKKNYKKIIAQRWSKGQIKILVQRILNAKRCNLSDAQISVLHKSTNGIPKFVEEIIMSFFEEKKIEVLNNVVTSDIAWHSIDMPNSLQEFLENRISNLYFKIENSRKALEVASVIGETFSDETLEAVSQLDDTYALLKKIELRTKVIKDLFTYHKWKFNHSLNHKTIYNSIGKKVSYLHQKVAEYLISEGSDDNDAIAFHFRKAQMPECAIEYDLKALETHINYSLFQVALQKVEVVIKNAEQLTFGAEYVLKAKYAKGRALFFLNRFNEAVTIFSNLLKKCSNKEATADIKRWIGRCYTSQNSQIDFQHGVSQLEDSQKLYAKIGDIKQSANVLSDLTVAYEHQNRYEDTVKTYQTAEQMFIECRDEIGINRLWRRSGMVLDGSLSSKLIMKAASKFREWEMLHEQVMCLNNAGVAYLYCGNEQETKNCLEKAISVSSEISNFGMDHILINLGIHHLLIGDIQESYSILEQAYEFRERDVTNLNMDILGSAVAIKTMPTTEALVQSERVYKQSLIEGELSYMIPALLNFTYALEKNKEIDHAIELLESIVPIKVPVQRYYAHCQQSKWFQRLLALYRLKGFNRKAVELEQSHPWCKTFKRVRFYLADFGAVPVQFCSP